MNGFKWVKYLTLRLSIAIILTNPDSTCHIRGCGNETNVLAVFLVGVHRNTLRVQRVGV